MSEVDTRSWWTEVEHLREPLERRSGARRSERRVGGEHAMERRTIKIRGQVAPGAPRRELRDIPAGQRSALYDLQSVAMQPDGVVEPKTPVRSPGGGRRRPARRPRERIGARPDRIAGWAVLFVLFMALIAATSAHGATAGATPNAGKGSGALVSQADAHVLQLRRAAPR